MIEQYSPGMRAHAIGLRSQNAATENTTVHVWLAGTRVPSAHQKGAPEPRPERLENRTVLQRSYSHSTVAMGFGLSS